MKSRKPLAADDAFFDQLSQRLTKLQKATAKKSRVVMVTEGSTGHYTGRLIFGGKPPKKVISPVIDGSIEAPSANPPS